MKRVALGAEHPDVSLCINNLALVVQARGNYTQAELLFRQASGILRTAFGEDHPSLATSLDNLAGVYIRWVVMPKRSHSINAP